MSHRPIVLLVDDCSDNRRLFERILQPHGYAIEHAADGQEGIDQALRLLPHVIVMDIMMPEVDGLEATRRLRASAEAAHIPIILCSALTGREDISAGLAAGADEYIFKPINSREFSLRVRSMVRLRDTQLEMERIERTVARRGRMLNLMQEFGRRIPHLTELEPLYELIVATAADLMESRRVSLLIPDESGGHFRIVSARGMEEGWDELRVPRSSPIAGAVFATRAALVGEGEHGYGKEKSGRHYASLPVVSTPLHDSEGTVGVLNITAQIHGQPYRPEDLQMLRQFAQTAAIAIQNIRVRTKLEETRDSIILSMARLSECRHQETGRHLERVRLLSITLAREAARDPRIGQPIDARFIADLGRAAPLHDIGKVAIPDHILLKPGRLTDEEFRQMQDHTRIGAETLRATVGCGGHDQAFLGMAMDVARYHHERWDGKGYPDGLAGERIPLAARIVAIADTYDAIRMRREYKPARSHEEATAELRNGAGGQFDPRLIQVYLAIESRFAEVFEQLGEEEAPAEPDLRLALTAV